MITRGKKEMMGEEELGQALSVSPDLVMTEEALSRMPPFLKSIANLDHRHGNGKARVEGIGVFGSEGYPVTRVAQGDRLSIRISVEFLEDVEKPNIGFMLRNRLGEDVTGSNVLFEGERLQPCRAGDQLSVDFVMDLPLLQGGFYHFSPAVAEGTLDQYEICDWIENAFAVEVVQRTATHGHMRIPMRVWSVNVPRTSHVL